MPHSTFESISHAPCLCLFPASLPPSLRSPFPLRPVACSVSRVPCSVSHMTFSMYRVPWFGVRVPPCVLDFFVSCFFLGDLWVCLLVSVDTASGCGRNVRAAGDHCHRRQLLLRESVSPPSFRAAVQSPALSVCSGTSIVLWYFDIVWVRMLWFLSVVFYSVGPYRFCSVRLLYFRFNSFRFFPCFRSYLYSFGSVLFSTASCRVVSFHYVYCMNIEPCRLDLFGFFFFRLVRGRW